MSELIGANIHVTGIVQGVGFRPFVYSLAKSLDLRGWVRNTSAGVDIQIDGSEPTIQAFLQRLRADAPSLAFIESIEHHHCPPDGFLGFEIIPSESLPGAFQLISPDICICQDCLREMLDPTDRRFRYPFINCTNCGPRFTIIKDIPYDRPNTTMRDFSFCPDCQAEYENPSDRRFHAQPVACPICGPNVWLETPEGKLITERDAAIIRTQELLLQGKIIAIKGLGGFHLACDATNPRAVNELRSRKLRAEKPFAVMVADLDVANEQCHCNPGDLELLGSRARPIVIAERRELAIVCPEVSPGQSTIGLMLPYTPLHYLLFTQWDSPSWERNTSLKALVMTSGNLSEEPIATDNQEARTSLGKLADAFLMHDRPIHTRCDDSVVRTVSIPENRRKSTDQDSRQENQSIREYPLRRSRGYAPFPVRLPMRTTPLLATGGELKNTFCLARDEFAFISPHIGDMQNYETYISFETGVSHYEKLYRIQPALIAYDMHPDYLASRYALERSRLANIPALPIQHHHAHIAACLVENGIGADVPAIGVAFDGTGYGTDGAIWGGEFLIATLAGFQHAAQLEYFPLPGGDRAIRKPARTALAYLWKIGFDWLPELPPANALCVEERIALRAQLDHTVNTPFTSSMGRLFDAVASIAGVRQEISYEAQAAIEFEAVIDPNERGSYRYEVKNNLTDPMLKIDPTPVLHSATVDRLEGIPSSVISSRFHRATARMVVDICLALREQHHIQLVALSGGVWQNQTLLTQTVSLLHDQEFSVILHHTVPANDGGISLGQAAIAAAMVQNRGV
jgi:hydrogenase maturation protein HypF